MAIHLYSWSELPRQTIFDGNLSRTALRTDGAIVTFNWFEPRMPRPAGVDPFSWTPQG
jgi:hypothetical protein